MHYLLKHQGAQWTRESAPTPATRRASHVVPSTMQPRLLTGGSHDTTRRRKSTRQARARSERPSARSLALLRSRDGTGLRQARRLPPAGGPSPRVHRRRGRGPPSRRSPLRLFAADAKAFTPAHLRTPPAPSHPSQQNSRGQPSSPPRSRHEARRPPPPAAVAPRLPNARRPPRSPAERPARRRQRGLRERLPSPPPGAAARKAGPGPARSGPPRPAAGPGCQIPARSPTPDPPPALPPPSEPRRRQPLTVAER